MARRFSHYVVWKGRKPGIYDSWAKCSDQVQGFSGPIYKGFHSHGDAARAFERDPLDYVRGIPGKLSGQKLQKEIKEARREAKRQKRKQIRTERKARQDATQSVVERQERLETPCLCVDGAFSYQRNRMEFQAIGLPEHAIVFEKGPYEGGGASIAEFVGLVQGLQYLQANGLDMPIYSDSKTAISWIRKKRLNSKVIKRDDCPELIKSMVADAMKWVRQNEDFLAGRIRKWHTRFWGENPADYGRK